MEKSIISSRDPTAAKESHLFGKHLGLLEKDTSIVCNRDKVAEALLKHCGKGNSNVNAVSVTADGNCLYNCLSMAVCGNKQRSMEMHWQSAIELLLQKEYYETYHATHSLDPISPTYKEACLDATKNHAYSSSWNPKAAASVLQQPIQSIYPTVNGILDKSAAILNHVFPPRISKNKNNLLVMWSRYLNAGWNLKNVAANSFHTAETNNCRQR